MQTNFVINIETSVLSSILFNPELMDDIANKLKPNDFYLPAHRDIYETMVQLHSDDIPIDEDFLIKKSKKTLNEKVLLEILSANPISNVHGYVRELKELSVRRQIQNFAFEIQKEADNQSVGNDDIFELLKEKEEQIRIDGIVTINKNSVINIEAKEPEFYCKQWLPIPKGTITMISAPGGTGKTWLIVQLALRFILENPNKKVFLWLSEDLESIIKHRMSDICESILSESLNDRFINIHTTDSFPTPLIERSKGTSKMSSRFNQIKAELKDYDLVVFDPLLAFYGGDENDNSEARIFMQPFMNWAKNTNKSVVFLHHSSKSIVQNSSNKSRGAGAFVDASRVCYEMNKIYKKDNQTLENTKSHLRDIKLSKDNYGAIKHLKNFNNTRQITPYDSSKDFIEIEFIDGII